MRRIGEKILWLRAMTYLKRHKPMLIGVTGSFGKTMTKEAITLALKGQRKVRMSHASYNTPIGVALSIVGMRAAQDKMGWMRLLAGSRVKETVVDPEPDTIVLELGADRPGDIDFLASKLPFQLGVVTGVGSAHLEYFIEKENIAHEKMSLLASLPQKGAAILNIDDPYVEKMANHVRTQVVWYGNREGAHVRLVRAERLGIQGFAVEIEVKGKRYEASFPHIAGGHQIMSALAALAVVYALYLPDKSLPRTRYGGGEGGSIRCALDSLRALKPPPGRMCVLKGKNGSTIIDDSYNAPPESVVKALKSLEEIKGRRKIAILGDMLELGAHSIQWHADIGRMVAEVADVFIAVGPQMKHAQAAALDASESSLDKEKRGGVKVDCHHFEDSRDVGKWLAGFLRKGDIVLVKGSRDMRMEEVMKRLLADPDRDSSQLVQ